MISLEGDNIEVTVPKKDTISNILISASIFLLFLGVVLFVLGEMKNNGVPPHEPLTMAIFLESFVQSIVPLLLFFLLSLCIFFTYTKCCQYLIEKIFGFFAFSLFYTISTILSLLFVFGTSFQNNHFFSAFGFYFVSFWYLTDAFSHKHYYFNVKINQTNNQITITSKFSTFLFLPTVDEDILIRENTSDLYNFFIRIKGQPEFESRFLIPIEDSNTTHWELDETTLYNELPSLKWNRFNYECYLLFKEIKHNQKILRDFYFPIGYFGTTASFLSFLDHLSNEIRLEYLKPKRNLLTDFMKRN